ncbi:YbaN family protein [Thermomonas fusca]|uniref:YbaN family protein n=1 Tax=Thermomonas fusca TaxID=215690 RepID=UPI00041A74EE|nr:YbaN family protein [Thermomonas fusca]
MTRWLWAGLAWTSLALGIIGAFLPVMPTVPFVLLSAFAATRGSDRLRRWLVEHPKFGRAILDWEQNGTVSRQAKRFAIGMMCVSSISMAIFAPRWWMAAIGIGVMALVSVWLWRRPEPRQ